MRNLVRANSATVKRKCFSRGRTTRAPEQSGETLMLARDFLTRQTLNDNTSRGWRKMAQLIMELPTGFAAESRSAELSQKNVYLGGTSNERNSSEGVYVHMTVDALHSIC